MRINSIDLAGVWSYPTREITNTNFAFWKNILSPVTNIYTAVNVGANIQEFANSSGKTKLIKVNCAFAYTNASSYGELWLVNSSPAICGGKKFDNDTVTKYQFISTEFIVPDGCSWKIYINNSDGANIDCYYQYTEFELD